MLHFTYSYPALNRDLHYDSDSESEDDDLESEIFGDFIVKPRYPQLNKTKSAKNPSTHKKDGQNQPCTPYIPPEILDNICFFVDQITLCRSIRLVSRTWSTIAKRHIDRKGTWTLGPQQDEDRLLSNIDNGLVNVLELNYKHGLFGYQPTSAPTGRIEPYHEWPWAWNKIVALLSGNSSDGMDDTQPAARNNCPMHRIKRLIVRSTSIWDLERVPALLPSMQWIRELELDALDCSTTIELFPILDLCSNLTSLSVQNTSPNSHIHVHWSSETNDVPEMEPSALVPLLNSHLSVQDRANISFQTYRLLHFSAKSVNFQHSAISNLLDACPRLQSCKIFRSKLSNAEGAIIYDYSELSSITEAMYRRAALVCPQLIEFHPPLVGPRDHLCRLDSLNHRLLTLKLAQELFPQTRFFSLQCCMPLEWRPSYDLRHFLGQLTHIEIESEPWFNLDALNRMLGYTHSILHLSAPSIRYHSPQRSVSQRTIAEVMEHIIARRTRSCTLKQQTQLYNWYYGWTYIPNKRHMKNLERVKKRLRSEKCLLERHLPVSAQWRCHNLQTLDLGLADMSSHKTTFEYISRACPRLVELTLRMEEFWLSENNWRGYHGQVPDLSTYSAKHAPWPGRPILALGSPAVVAAESGRTTGCKPRKEDRLSYLKRLTIVTVGIPGILNVRDVDFMMMQNSGSRNASPSSAKTCYWPRLEYFSVEYRDIPLLWHNGRKVYELDCLVKRMQVIRPTVLVNFKHSQTTL